MCIVGVAIDCAPGVRLVLLSNRDEAFARPTAPWSVWDEGGVVGGRDLERGGSWLAFAAADPLRFAAVTNVRHGPAVRSPSKRSRGLIVADFLRGSRSPSEFVASLSPADYDGVNVLVSDAGETIVWSSTTGRSHRLGPGIHAVCNASFGDDASWPKVVKVKAGLAATLHRSTEAHNDDLDALESILLDKTVPDDDQLPDTGVGLDTERFLAPVFIAGSRYGTRTSTVVVVHSNGSAVARETTFLAAGQPKATVRFQWKRAS
ncbi:NRDE family protein [Plasmodiophora brassicae]|uniref:NRDE family protein n=1 Tax=Plasmodiophora brassicae TaxID=37360 RepID=A0A0G4IW79_PLABS|nr:hypothetical protein PBRA_001227 [Plasmodiophora brassicae]SPQ97336.1 unnamed protein product [Plasmodiophora brassicae]